MFLYFSTPYRVESNAVIRIHFLKYGLLHLMQPSHPETPQVTPRPPPTLRTWPSQVSSELLIVPIKHRWIVSSLREFVYLTSS